jgi:NTP pyrophosphatase (non-canonical NTP hydrolase)
MQAKTFKEAQKLVKEFAERNGWSEAPSIDKFDHMHEELIEMSKYLRYKNEAERTEIIDKKHEKFTEEFGDLIFGICRLANQLKIDIEEAFALSSSKILAEYTAKRPEHKNIHTENL